MAEKKKFRQPEVDSNTVAELSQKLLEANARLQQAERERKLMLENISHDLRAPLTAIRSAIDYLNQKNEAGELNSSGDEMTQMLHLIDNRTRTLEVLIRDLYYLTCIENGSDELKLQRVPLSQFLEEYFFAAQIDDKYSARNLICEIPDDYDAEVNVDVGKH